MEEVDKLIEKLAKKINEDLAKGRRVSENVEALAALIIARASVKQIIN